jgi:ubiquinone/menaquinone biosynthesis C-methylase UbiE
VERYVPAAGRASLNAWYDRTVALTMREPLWRPALVGAIADELPRGGTAVEIGCGTGTLTTALAAACPDATVIGVDGDPEILALARAKPGAERVRWVEGMAGELPLADGSAGAALCSLVLHHLTDESKERALRDIARVLGDGGVFHVADWGPPRTPLAALGARSLQVFDGAAGPESLLAGRLPELLAAAGFADVRRSRALGTVWGTLELWTGRR